MMDEEVADCWSCKNCAMASYCEISFAFIDNDASSGLVPKLIERLQRQLNGHSA